MHFLMLKYDNLLKLYGYDITFLIMSMPYVPYGHEDDERSSQSNDLQFRQYQLLEELQNLVHKLPMNLQQRLSYNLLSDIAAALLDNAVFTIVGDLKEIQHLTEKTLFNQRQKLLIDHKDMRQKLRLKQTTEVQTCRPHNLAILKSEHVDQKKDLETRIKAELLRFDKRLLQELDNKVAEQQVTMQSAGVPGFYVTNDPKEVKLQMSILQLVLDLKPE